MSAHALYVPLVDRLYCVLHATSSGYIISSGYISSSGYIGSSYFGSSSRSTDSGG